MNYKMIVLDIDGTVTNSQKLITPNTRDALIQLQEKGGIVAVASGRPTKGVAPIADELQLDRFGSYVLSFNGAKIIDWNTKKEIYSHTLPSGIVKQLYKDAVQYQTGIITYQEDFIISGTNTDRHIELESRINHMNIHQVNDFIKYVTFPVSKCLLTADADDLERIEPILAAKYAHQANVYRSEPFFLEVMPQNIDKAYCLAKLLNILHVSREEMVCCGDGYNDLTMIQYAGLGVAMANAQDSVKEVADYITLSNDEDGIAKVVHKFFLGDAK